MRMRGLTILVATADGERFHAALTFAAASAAAGAVTQLHLHGGAVALLVLPIAMEQDALFAASGLPTLAQLFEEALGLGVAVSACQSGLALCGISAEAFDTRVMMDGPVGVLLRGSDDRLLSF
jgi:predicted peroxiredoxin